MNKCQSTRRSPSEDVMFERAWYYFGGISHKSWVKENTCFWVMQKVSRCKGCVCVFEGKLCACVCLCGKCFAVHMLARLVKWRSASYLHSCLRRRSVSLSLSLFAVCTVAMHCTECVSVILRGGHEVVIPIVNLLGVLALTNLVQEGYLA